MTSKEQDDKMPNTIPQIVEPIPEYAMHYSDKGFWNKLRKYAIKAGQSVVYQSLLLFYVLKDSNTPYWARSVIITALGYFILPLDLIPDIIPVAGFADDLGALITAVYTVGRSISEEHHKQAQAKMQQWFPVELVAKKK
jgi:uncharacterized membrane protein YkvA (DUF1232 family)